MRRRAKTAAVILGVLILAGTGLCWPRLPAGASAAMDGADTFELLSVDPEPLSADAATTAPAAFHRFRVLGRTTVTDLAVRRRLADALRGGVPWTPLDGPYQCFSPRVGLRLTRAGHTVDLLVCFACKQGIAWRDGEPAGGWITNRSPKAAFDDVLKVAGVPLVPDDD